MVRYAGLLAVLALVGCGDATSDGSPDTSGSATSEGAPETTEKSSAAAANKRTLTPLTLGGSGSSDAAKPSASATAAQQVETVIEKLKPLQVILGTWRGTTRREFGGFKAVDEHEWVWDLTTEPDQPALVMKSGKSPYVKEARVTWLTDADSYRLSVVSPEDETRVFAGEFGKPVQDVAGDDGKLHRTYQLVFTQTEPADASEQWQFAVNQQENNRYLLEVSRKRGKAAFRRIDTVSTQREGTSFALSDSDYGDKTCIISQGLGTISVSYQGKTYWVCCTGCKAAFEEDPERWINRATR